MAGINPFICGEGKGSTTCIYPRAAYFNAKGVTQKPTAIPSTDGGSGVDVTSLNQRVGYFNAKGVTQKPTAIASAGSGSGVDVTKFGKNINYGDNVGKNLDISLDDYFAKKQV